MPKTGGVCNAILDFFISKNIVLSSDLSHTVNHVVIIQKRHLWFEKLSLVLILAAKSPSFFMIQKFQLSCETNCSGNVDAQSTSFFII